MVFEPGVSTFIFEDRLLSENELAQIKEAGFNLIEVWCRKTHFDFTDSRAIKQLKGLVKSFDIKVSSFHSPFGEKFDLGSLDEPVRKAAVKGIITTLPALEELGGDKVVVHPGIRVKEGDDRKLIVHQVYRSLEEILKACEKKKKTMAVENMLSGMVGGSSEELWKMANSFSSIYIGICLDTGHINATGEDLVHVTKKFQSRLVTLHISDNTGDSDSHLVPYEGKIDWPEFLAALAQGSYDGPFMYELIKREDNFAVLKKAKTLYGEFKQTFKKNLV